MLATHWPDGSVLLSPVWHEWRDGGFNVGVPSGDVKARHLARDPRATIVVFDHSWPGRVRYLGSKNGNAYADRVGPGLVVRLEPGTTRAWDFVDEPTPDADVAVFPSGNRQAPRHG